KIYKPTNNNIRTSSNTSRANQDNSPRINKGAGHVARECQKPKRAKDAAYHKEKMLLCKQEEAGFQLNAEQADWRDDADDESKDKELEAHYIEQIDQDDDDDDLANERDLFASLIEKLKCEIDDNKNIINFWKHQTRPKKFQAELDRRNDVQYASKVEIDCAKAKGDLLSYKMEFEKSSIVYTQKINDLNQTISDMKKELFAHQETISILSQQKEAQLKFYKTRKDKEIDKVIVLENKIKDLDNIVYKTGQSVQTMNMLNPPEYDEVIRLEKESQSKLSDLIRPFDYEKLNNLYDFSFHNMKSHLNIDIFAKSLKAKTSNVNFFCATYGKCVLNVKHDMCVLHSFNDVNSRTKMTIAVPDSTREPKRTINHSVAKPLRKIVASESTNQKPRHTTMKLYENVSKTCSWWYPKSTPPGYKWKPKSQIGNVNLNVSMPLGNASKTANILEPMTPRCSTMSNTTLHSNSFAARRDYPIYRRLWVLKAHDGNLKLLINFVEKFLDLEVAFRKSTCYIRDLKGNDLLTGSRGTDLYSITLQDTSSPNPICLMAKATSSQAWLWHRYLSHLNFDTINLLSKNDIVIGLLKLKFVKDHLCSSYEVGKAKQKLVQRGLHAQVRIVQTDKGTEFLNKTLHAYFDSKGIHHQTSVTRTPEQNGVVKRRNRTLVEAAQTMLSTAKVPLFFWAEAIATSCFTQNRS
nr:integrase, catalytic region, zinc finger, CCHC-type, peptidase aspartic, catalytic [Tanacetum cinerariifolium]